MVVLENMQNNLNSDESLVSEYSDLEYGENRIIPIRYPDGTEGQSVFLEMAEGSYNAPVAVVGQEPEFKVRTVEGAGTLFVQRLGKSGVRRVRLRENREYVLREGDIYGYVPYAGKKWTVRDDSSVPFEPMFETDVTANTPHLEGGRVLRAIQCANLKRTTN